MTLHETILEKHHDILRKLYRNDQFEDLVETAREASLLALAEQQAFYEWLGRQSWIPHSGNVWYNRRTEREDSLENLYTIWKGETP